LLWSNTFVVLTVRDLGHKPPISTDKTIGAALLQRPGLLGVRHFLFISAETKTARSLRSTGAAGADDARRAAAGGAHHHQPSGVLSRRAKRD